MACPTQGARLMAELRTCLSSLNLMRMGVDDLMVENFHDAGNAAALLPGADGALVGTSLKRDGDVNQPVEVERVKALRALFRAAGPLSTSG